MHAAPRTLELLMATWSFDTTHSEISFSIRHMMFAKVRGTFAKWSGTVLSDDSGAITGVTAEIDVDTINTNESQRDAHLRSADFFDAATFPKIAFRSTGLRGDTAGAFEIDGDLTIHGVTRPVTLRAEFAGGGKDPWGNTRRGYRATARINRVDFGLTWNAALELGGVLVGEQVDLEIETQLVAQG